MWRVVIAGIEGLIAVYVGGRDLGELGLGSGEASVLGHLVGDARAAENGGADETGDDVAAERGRHEPEAIAVLEGRVVGGRLVLVVEYEVPAGRVEDEAEQAAEERADDEVERERVAEALIEERQLSDHDQNKAETVEGRAGGD